MKEIKKAITYWIDVMGAEIRDGIRKQFKPQIRMGVPKSFPKSASARMLPNLERAQSYLHKAHLFSPNIEIREKVDNIQNEIRFIINHLLSRIEKEQE